MGVAVTTYNGSGWAPQVVANSTSPNEYVTTVAAEKFDIFVNNAHGLWNVPVRE